MTVCSDLSLFAEGKVVDVARSLAPLPPVQHPRENPPSAAKISLGRELFFDARLSRNDRVSCASCHEPNKGFSNGGRFGKGIRDQRSTRNVPSLINVGYSHPLFWDGRSATLEEQALLPIQNAAEMDMPLEVLEKKLHGVAEYRRQFAQVFDGAVTAARIGQALAAFQRTIVSTDTPLDRYVGGDRTALTPRATKGMQLFFGRARCSICHKGPELTDNRFHNIGTVDPEIPDDSGRRAVTGRAEDQGAFRTPQLREVARTAPYMHSGKFQTLSEVVEHYNFGGVTDTANDHRDEILEVLYLSEDEVEDLVAFLREGLTSPDPPIANP
ncbi:cytochrome-c peroxidase [Lignipirellula cremea]|nr:cytochrome c peroxidase [Lignipirellula cremea]